MTISELAKMMNQSESDVSAFVECLRVWMNKGMTIEQAVERHMTQMTRFANNACNLPKGFALDVFYY
jgi:hypothetical protein